MFKKKIWANFQRIIELFTQKIVSRLSKIWVWDPGSGIRDPGSEKNLFRIPDPGVKKAPDPGSRIRIPTLVAEIQFFLKQDFEEGRRGLISEDLSIWKENIDRKSNKDTEPFFKQLKLCEHQIFADSGSSMLLNTVRIQSGSGFES